MSEPRALTPEEMRAKMFDHMADMLAYWRDVDTSRYLEEGQSELQYRMEGFLFSLLVMFDGGTDLPGMAITPMPHPDDEAYYKEQGGNWWAEEEINDTQMHEIFPWEKCR